MYVCVFACWCLFVFVCVCFGVGVCVCACVSACTCVRVCERVRVFSSVTTPPFLGESRGRGRDKRRRGGGGVRYEAGRVSDKDKDQRFSLESQIPIKKIPHCQVSPAGAFKPMSGRRADKTSV